jgi:N-acetylglucosaminyl-diphospho-decaprenol L-rhamnosyltransferase
VNDVDFSVVVVTFNSALVIEACLDSISAMPPRTEILVADNASTDSTVALIADRFPSVRILPTGGNLGFAKAVNFAVAESRGRNIVLLNPDATISNRVLAELSGYLDENEQVGIVAPAIVHPQGRLRTSSAGRTPTAWRMFCHYFGLSRLLPDRPRFEGHYLLMASLVHERKVDWVTGACFAVSRKTWEALGGLTERWFMYAEDIEFCHRVRLSGRDIVLNPELEATHLVGASTQGEELSLNPAWVLNLFDFYSRDLSSSWPMRLNWRFVMSAGLASRGIVYSLLSLRGTESSRVMWRREAVRFFSFAKAVVGAPRFQKDEGKRSDDAQKRARVSAS